MKQHLENIKCQQYIYKYYLPTEFFKNSTVNVTAMNEKEAYKKAFNHIAGAYGNELAKEHLIILVN